METVGHCELEGVEETSPDALPKEGVAFPELLGDTDTLPVIETLIEAEALKELLFDTVVNEVNELEALTLPVSDTVRFADADTLGLPDSVADTFVEALKDFSEVEDTDFLGEAELVTVSVRGEFEAVVVVVADPLGDLELLDDTVVVLLKEELPDSVILTHELTDGDEETLLDI